MAKVEYGTGGGDARDLIAAAQARKQALDDMNRKSAEYERAQERTSATETELAGKRTNLAGATRELSSALSGNVNVLASETTAINANTAALERNLSVRRSVAGVGGVATGGSGGGGRRTPPVAVGGAGGYEEDPMAASRYQMALGAQAKAERELAASRAAYTAAVKPGSGMGTADAAALLGQREAAAENVTAAKAKAAVAKADLAVQEQIASLRVQEMAAQRLVNDETIARGRAEAEAAAAAQRVAAASMMGANERIAMGGSAAFGGLSMPTGGLSRGAADYLAVSGIGRGLPNVTRTGVLTTEIDRGALAHGVGFVQHDAPIGPQTRAVSSLEGLAARQKEVNIAFHESVASYAASSSALSRHGALTTEFIQAFARGEVTLKEFESQMLSTIGKFGGWAVAGGLVFGAFEMVKHALEGISQTQAGIQNLGRFIPGLGGPAGGGSNQIGAAEATMRDISTQFNVPISEVVNSMQVMARTFKNVHDAGEATRAVLAAVRLDQVPEAQATTMLQGIAQGYGLTRGSDLTGLMNSLNELQVNLGARVSQTLPAVQAAAPTATIAGLPLPELAALSALGVRAGVSGNVLGTGLLRSMTIGAYGPVGQQGLATYGIRTVGPEGNVPYGTIMNQVMDLVGKGSYTNAAGQTKALTNTDVQNLALALGGGVRGLRSIAPLLSQELNQPGMWDAAQHAVAHPRSYQQDLDAVLGSVGERFKSIGISLQNFGSTLAAMGALAPVTGLLEGLKLLTSAVEHLLAPVAAAGSVFSELPKGVQDVIGALAAMKLAQMAVNTGAGQGALAFVGRLPGMSALGSRDRDIVSSTLARQRTYQLPEARSAEEGADRDAFVARKRLAMAMETQARTAEADAAVLAGPKRGEAYQAANDRALANEEMVARQTAVVAEAEAKAAWAGEYTAKVMGQIAIMKDRTLGLATKTAFAEEQGMIAAVERTDQRAAMAARLRGESPALAAAAGGGAAAVIDPLAVGKQVAQDVSSDATVMGNVSRNMAMVAPVATSGERAGLMGRLSSRAENAAGWARENWSGGVGALAGLMGTQMLGGAVGGGAGQFISGVGGGAFGGMMIGSMMGNSMLGLGAGLALSGYQQGGAGGKAASIAGGALAGGQIGLLLGGGNPLFMGAGALIGGGAALAANIFGGGGGPPASQTIAQQAAEATASGPAQAADLLRQALEQRKKALGAEPGITDHLLNLTSPVSGYQMPTGGAAYRARAADLEKQAAAVKAGGLGSAASVTAFGDQFAADLETAFGGTGTAATTAQTRVTAEVTQLAAKLKAFGAGSAQGQQATAKLEAVITAAAADASTSPDKAGQIIDSASAALTASIEQRFKMTMASSADAGISALAGVRAGYGAIQNSYSVAVENAQSKLAISQAALNEAIKAGNQKQVEHWKAQVANDQNSVAGLQAQQQNAADNSKLAVAADAGAAYSQASSTIAANSSLQEARAGGDKLKALGVQAATHAQEMAAALAYLANGGDPTTGRNDVTKAQAAMEATRQQIVAQGMVELKSKGTLAEARIDSSLNPVGAAKQAARDATAQYDYMVKNKAEYDPADIRDAQSAMIKAKQAVTDAIATAAQTMRGIETNIAELRDTGDKLKQANDALVGATGDLAAARTPEQRKSAQEKVLQAQIQQHDAATSRTAALFELTSTREQGDSMAQAQTAIAAARAALHSARGVDEQIAAEQQLAAANNQYNQALESRYTAQANLLASETTDPLTQLRDQIAGARNVLRHAQGPDAKISAQTNLNTLRNSYEQQLISTREGTIQFQLSMQQITNQQAINQLQDLLKMKGMTLQTRQQIQQQIRQLQMGDTSGGAFDLAPGNIKMPTVYDVSKAMRGAGLMPHPSGAVVNAQAATQINVWVNNKEDVPLVADAIDRGTRGHLRARLRAAGVRGT